MRTKRREARPARLVLIAVAALLLLSPLPGAAQQPTWTLGSGTAERSVTEVDGRGYPAIPLSALVSVGVEVGSGAGMVVARVGGREVRFTPEASVFQAGAAEYDLAHPVYEQDGVMYLPVRFLLDQLPILAGPSLVVDREERRIFRVGGSLRQAASPDEVPAEEVRPREPESSLPNLVVIDAGHGGRDPGAVGPGGTREKDVVLAVSLKLAELLRGEAGYDIRMTRDRDTLVALRDRPDMANQWRADGQPALFISVHANASERRSARGFETFFLSEALTEEARRVAERENAAVQFEEEGSSDADPLGFILDDLRRNAYLHESSGWAGTIQSRLGEIHPGPDRGVKQAGFIVLNGAFMPAVLVELGFLSNPEEERMLADAGYQAKLADRLADAVREYFETSPDATPTQ